MLSTVAHYKVSLSFFVCLCLFLGVWSNRSFPSCFEHHYENEAKCIVFYLIWKLVFIHMQTKLIFIWKALHLTSLSYWGSQQLGNDLFRQQCWRKCNVGYKSNIARVEPVQLHNSTKKSLTSVQSYIFSNGRVSPHEHALVHSPVTGSCLWPLAGKTWQWPSLATLDFPSEKTSKITRVTF